MKYFIIVLLLLIASTALFAESTASACGVNQYSVRSHPRRAYYKGDGTFVRASYVSSSCKDKSKSYIFWSEKLKSVRPDIWPNETEKMKQWTDEELNRVLEVLEEIPEELWPEKINSIFRSSRSKDFPNPASNVGGHIALYDSAFNDTKERNLTRILIHELSHILYKNPDNVISDDYKKAARWERGKDSKGKSFISRRRYGFVQEDGKISDEEDFANNLEYFIFEPDKLKRADELIYSWMNKKYGNLKLKGKR